MNGDEPSGCTDSVSVLGWRTQQEQEAEDEQNELDDLRKRASAGDRDAVAELVELAGERGTRRNFAGSPTRAVPMDPAG